MYWRSGILPKDYSKTTEFGKFNEFLPTIEPAMIIILTMIIFKIFS